MDEVDPKVGHEPLNRYVSDLVARAVALHPRHIISVMANVCELCQVPFRAAGLDVIDERILLAAANSDASPKPSRAH